MNATEARNDLYALVKRAEEHGRTTLIHKRQDRALLAPLDRLPVARKADALPSHTLSAAQGKFGELITKAAQGEPQVLRRGTTPVAVLLPVDTAFGSPSSDPAAGAATAGGAVDSNQERSSVPRRLATLGDAIGAVLTSGPAGGPMFGLPGLDVVAGRLQAGRLTLVAAPPNVGGSLLGLAAARQTALIDGHRVLYAASGPNRDDIFRRILSAETNGDYPRLKQGRLTPYEQEVAQQLRQAPLLIDDGSNLTAEAIADTAPHVQDLALVVVDRLQAAHSARLPLSGDRLPDASQVLASLARTLHVPVLAVLDSDDPALLSLLDTDVLMTLTPTTDPSRVQVTISERDFGTIGSAYLQPDLLHARFTDVPTSPVVELTAVELADAALPYTSGAQQGLPAEATHVLSALRAAVKGEGTDGADADFQASLVSAFAKVTQLPDTPEGRRLADALRAYDPHLSTYCPALRTDTETGAAGATPQQAPAAPAVAQHAAGTEPAQDDGSEDDAWVQPGDEEEPEGVVFPALSILKDAVGRSTYHPIAAIRKEDRDAEPWTIFSEVMDGEPRWVHPDITTEKTRAGKRDRLIVPEEFGAGQLCTIDRNGSYPSACSAVPLAPNKLMHTGPLKEVGKDRAGAFLITVPAWTHRNMPHPLGRLAERTDDQGRVWVTTPHLRQLQKLIKNGFITEELVIHDSWTGKANESLFKHFYEKAREARAQLVQAGGEPYVEYKRRLSIALRLLWPKGEKVNSPFWRPDWRMALVAEASVRHWSVAHRAVEAGHTLIALRNVDEAVFWTPDGNAPDTYKVGTGFGEVKVKSDAAGSER